MDSVEWQRLGAGFGMRVVLSGGAVHRFGGFVNDEKEFEKLKEFFKVGLSFPRQHRKRIYVSSSVRLAQMVGFYPLQEFYNVDLKHRDLSLTGRNWGTVNFDAASLEFAIDKHNAFEVRTSS